MVSPRLYKGKGSKFVHWKEAMQLYREHRDVLFATALSVSGEKSAAEDAVHEALLSVASIKSRPANWRAYLITAVRNAALKQRRVGYTKSLPERWVVAAQESNDSERQAFLVDLAKAVQKLAQPTREVIVLHAIKGMTFREISEVSGESINTISSRYRRGICSLGETLNEDE